MYNNVIPLLCSIWEGGGKLQHNAHATCKSITINCSQQVGTSLIIIHGYTIMQNTIGWAIASEMHGFINLQQKALCFWITCIIEQLWWYWFFVSGVQQRFDCYFVCHFQYWDKHCDLSGTNITFLVLAYLTSGSCNFVFLIVLACLFVNLPVCKHN